jgi:hypothetical protein
MISRIGAERDCTVAVGGTKGYGTGYGYTYDNYRCADVRCISGRDTSQFKNLEGFGKVNSNLILELQVFSWREI